MSGTSAAATGALDVAAIRAQVPALHQQIHGHPLTYLDNGATSLKPQAVLDALVGYYAGYCANVHRGVHTLSMRATAALEHARATVAAAVGAPAPEAIVFVRGATEAINLVAQTWGRRHLGPGDEVIVSALEHHSNIVPWQMVTAERGATLRVVPFDRHGVLDLTAFAELLCARTKLVAMGHVSNALGTVHPVAQITAMAHAVGARVVIDGAQAVPHGGVDVAALGCDFYAFSGHKVFGPTGIGVLTGRFEALDDCGPWHGGGDMIRHVSFDGTTYAELPARLEAGTPAIAEAIGLGAALTWQRQWDREAVQAHEQRLLRALEAAVRAVPGGQVIGEAAAKAGVVSFVIDGAHPTDVGMLLDQQGVAIRTGHHCAEPAMTALGLAGTARASVALYNDDSDVERFAKALVMAARLLR